MSADQARRNGSPNII